ncbi:hypothetical protein OAS39_00965 [Pirellulales bacterium]|nr:hypothetical protein [Pirellulales bacterium]
MMRLSLSYNAVSVLLTALMLAGSVGAHAFGHAHVGGDEFHSHADGAIVVHDCGSHRCAYCNDHQEQHRCTGDYPLAAASVSHTHLTLFGFDFSIPPAGDSDDDHDNPLSTTFVGLSDDCPIVLVARSLDIDLLRALLLTASVGDLVASPTATFAMPQAPSAPLCDSARFERSGVLLI